MKIDWYMYFWAYQGKNFIKHTWKFGFLALESPVEESIAGPSITANYEIDYERDYTHLHSGFSQVPNRKQILQIFLKVIYSDISIWLPLDFLWKIFSIKPFSNDTWQYHIHQLKKITLSPKRVSQTEHYSFPRIIKRRFQRAMLLYVPV